MSIEAITIIGKAFASVAIALAVAVAVYKTEEPICLWALFIAAFMW